MIQKLLTSMLPALGLYLTLMPCLRAQSHPSLLGIWQDETHPDKLVQFFPHNGGIQGKAVSNDPAQNGKLVLKDLVWNNNTRSYQGVLISPDDDRQFLVSLTVKDVDHFYFKVKVLLFSKFFHFKRVNG
ncbi:hypothetical protein [Xanthocytophaga agilis]|uniref:DUF2147 domain-containing protein n=1 Tax=Xanthocytophaga agilis TaxID=3048010 RepID=A0AAE3R9H6_9BACT|nr:hypothetical protein [Xanthocytophaga agilis]MDJ1506106.1 hypothetical protein [Xanthocytophaga agilis]